MRSRTIPTSTPNLSAVMRPFFVALCIMALSACQLTPNEPTGGTFVASTVGADDTRIAYDVRGSGDMTIVFVHGWSCDRSYWREQVDYFAQRHRVVTVDLGGHGESGADRTDWTMASFGEDVAAVVEELGADNVVLIGHSMGGPVVLEAAMRLPQRVVKVIGVDTLKDVSRKPPSREVIEGFLVKAKADFPGFVREDIRNALFVPSAPAELAEWVIEDMVSANPQIAIEASVQLGMFDAGKALAELQDVPITLIQADYRPTKPEALADAHPNAKEIIIANTSHFLMMEKPGEFNKVLETELDRLSSHSPERQ